MKGNKLTLERNFLGQAEQFKPVSNQLMVKKSKSGSKSCWLEEPRGLPFPGRKLWRSLEFSRGRAGGATNADQAAEAAASSMFELLQHATSAPLTSNEKAMPSVDDAVDRKGEVESGTADSSSSSSSLASAATSRFSSLLSKSGKRFRALTGSSLGSYVILCRALDEQVVAASDTEALIRKAWRYVCTQLEPQLKSMAVKERPKFLRDKFRLLAEDEQFLEESSNQQQAPGSVSKKRGTVSDDAESIAAAAAAAISTDDDIAGRGAADSEHRRSSAHSAEETEAAAVAASDSASNTAADEQGLAVMEERFRSLFGLWDERLVTYFNVVYWRRTPMPAWLFISSNFVALVAKFNNRRRELISFRSIANISVTGKTSIEIVPRTKGGPAGGAPPSALSPRLGTLKSLSSSSATAARAGALDHSGATPVSFSSASTSKAPASLSSSSTSSAAASVSSFALSESSGSIIFTAIKRTAVYELLEQLWTLTLEFLLERAEHSHALTEANFERSKRLPKDGTLPRIISSPRMQSVPSIAAPTSIPGDPSPIFSAPSSPSTATSSSAAVASRSDGSARALDQQRRSKLFSRLFRVPRSESLLFTCDSKHYIAETAIYGTIQLSTNFLCFAAQDNFVLRVIPLLRVTELTRQASKGSWSLIRIDTRTVNRRRRRANTAANNEKKTTPSSDANDSPSPLLDLGDESSAIDSTSKAALAAARIAASQGPSFQFALRGPNAYDVLKKAWVSCIENPDNQKIHSPSVPKVSDSTAREPPVSVSGSFVPPEPCDGGPLTSAHFRLLKAVGSSPDHPEETSVDQSLFTGDAKSDPLAPPMTTTEPAAESASEPDPFHDLVAKSNARQAAVVSSSASASSSLLSSFTAASTSRQQQMLDQQYDLSDEEETSKTQNTDTAAATTTAAALEAPTGDTDSTEATETQLKLMALNDTLEAAEKQSPADESLLALLREEVARVESTLSSKFGVDLSTLASSKKIRIEEKLAGDGDAAGSVGSDQKAQSTVTKAEKKMAYQIRKLRRYATVYGRDLTMATALPLRQIVRRGIPHVLRAELWKWMAGASFKQELNPGHYQRLLDEHAGQESVATEEIERDLHRSLPEHEFFQSEAGISSLRRVLTAYSWHNVTTGYCQGLNIVCAMLLVLMSEEDAFWLLVAVVEDLVPEYYRRSMVGSNVDQKVFQELVCTRLPRLHAHTTEIGLPLVMLSLPWFLCLFIGYVPFDVALRILDCFFLEGPKVLFQVGLAVLSLCEERMMASSDPVTVREILKEPLDADRLAQVAFTDFADVAGAEIARLRNTHKATVVKELLEKNKKTMFRELTARTSFEKDELETLYAVFQAALGDHDHATLGLSQFELLFQQFAPWWSHHIPAVPAGVVMHAVDSNDAGVMEFRELVLLLALLRQPRSNQRQMIAFVFRLFDATTCYLSRGHFEQALHALRVILKQAADSSVEENGSSEQAAEVDSVIPTLSPSGSSKLPAVVAQLDKVYAHYASVVTGSSDNDERAASGAVAQPPPQLEETGGQKRMDFDGFLRAVDEFDLFTTDIKTKDDSHEKPQQSLDSEEGTKVTTPLIDFSDVDSVSNPPPQSSSMLTESEEMMNSWQLA